MILKPSAQRVQDKLTELGFACQVIELAESTRSAAEAAEAVGCEVGQIAKSLIFQGRESGKAILIIASGANRVNEKRMKNVIGEKLKRPDADFVRAQTGFAIGGVPPLGHDQALTTYIDEDLLNYDQIWAAAGHPNALFSLTGDELVRDVNLAVDAGQVMALLGANGAGKTTLMRIVAGLSRPDQGEVTLGGVALSQAGHELRRYIGMVSHQPLLYDNLTAWENLDFFARMYDMVEPEERIESLLRRVDLWSWRRDPVRTYSRGMVQRLSIARSILHDPPVLLLDEPDTGLDQANLQVLHELIRMLAETERAILLTTHHIERARAWADCAVQLQDGKIVSDE